MSGFETGSDVVKHNLAPDVRGGLVNNFVQTEMDHLTGPYDVDDLPPDADLMGRIDAGPEVTKLMFTLDCGALLASPSVYSPKALPPAYFYTALALLMVAFFALFPSLLLQRAYPKAAKIQALIGTACVAAAVPTVAAGLIPNGLLRLVVWVPFALLLVFALAKILFIKGLQQQVIKEDDSIACLIKASLHSVCRNPDSMSSNKHTMSPNKLLKLFEDDVPMGEVTRRILERRGVNSSSPTVESGSSTKSDSSSTKSSSSKSESSAPMSKKRVTKRKVTTTLVKTGFNKKRKVDDEVKTKKVTKKVTKIVSTDQGDVQYVKLDTRSVPMTLVKAMLDMNDAQKKSVCEIGFGSILQLTSKHLPLYLGHWVVEHFDAHKVCLKMADGECVLIDEKDVYIALGIPLGGLEIKASGVSAAQKRWRQSFQKSRPHPNDIVNAMMQSKEGVEFFKKCFMVVFISTIIESNTNGTINDSYFDALEDVEGIKSYNWCGFPLERLIEAKKLWDTEKQCFFKGSLLFLVLFYVDRVMYCGKKVPRPIPLFIEWTEKKLTNRQEAEMTDGFGCGRVLNSVDLHAPQIDESVGCSRAPTSEIDLKKLGLKSRVWDQIEVMSNSISTFVELVKEAVVEDKVDDEFKDMTEVGMQLVGQGTSRSNSSSEPPNSDDPFAWCSSQEE